MQSLWRMWNNNKETDFEWDNEPYKIRNTCYTLKGWSQAALRTNFYIPELRIMLDAGLSANVSPEYIMITHCHSDHCANVPYHLYACNKKISIFAPKESHKNIDRYIKTAYLMSANVEDESLLDVTQLYDVIPVVDSVMDIMVGTKTEQYTDENGNQQMRSKGGKSIKVEIINCDHSVPCVGYGLSETRTKLKPEYEELKGREIGELRKNGIEVCYTYDFNFFCYLGDTSHEILNDTRLEKYSTLMIECTFIYEEEHDNAILTKHMYWGYLKPYVIAHPNINFILYHFSQRYKPEQIKEFFRKETEENSIENIKIWIST